MKAGQGGGEIVESLGHHAKDVALSVHGQKRHSVFDGRHLLA
jgi:hypothetical protein